jgi:hypothetical protein
MIVCCARDARRAAKGSVRGANGAVDTMGDDVSFRVSAPPVSLLLRSRHRVLTNGARFRYPVLLGANLKRRTLFDNSGWEAER